MVAIIWRQLYGGSDLCVHKYTPVHCFFSCSDHVRHVVHSVVSQSVAIIRKLVAQSLESLDVSFATAAIVTTISALIDDRAISIY